AGSPLLIPAAGRRDGDGPTEAALFELVRDLPAGAGSPASIGIKPVRANVDVLVHHRHLKPVAGIDVKVTLLRFDATGVPANAWDVILTDWRPAIEDLLKVGNSIPALPAGCGVAGRVTPRRRPHPP